MHIQGTRAVIILRICNLSPELSEVLKLLVIMKSVNINLVVAIDHTAG